MKAGNDAARGRRRPDAPPGPTPGPRSWTPSAPDAAYEAARWLLRAGAPPRRGPQVCPARRHAPCGPPPVPAAPGGDLPPDGDGLGGTPTSGGGPEAGPREREGQDAAPASTLKAVPSGTLKPSGWLNKSPSSASTSAPPTAWWPPCRAASRIVINNRTGPEPHAVHRGGHEDRQAAGGADRQAPGHHQPASTRSTPRSGSSAGSSAPTRCRTR